MKQLRKNVSMATMKEALEAGEYLLTSGETGKIMKSVLEDTKDLLLKIFGEDSIIFKIDEYDKDDQDLLSAVYTTPETEIGIKGKALLLEVFMCFKHWPFNDEEFKTFLISAEALEKAKAEFIDFIITAINAEFTEEKLIEMSRVMAATYKELTSSFTDEELKMAELAFSTVNSFKDTMNFLLDLSKIHSVEAERDYINLLKFADIIMTQERQTKVFNKFKELLKNPVEPVTSSEPVTSKTLQAALGNIAANYSGSVVTHAETFTNVNIPNKQIFSTFTFYPNAIAVTSTMHAPTTLPFTVESLEIYFKHYLEDESTTLDELKAVAPKMESAFSIEPMVIPVNVVEQQ